MIMNPYNEYWLIAFALHDISLLHRTHGSAVHGAHIATCCRHHAFLFIPACSYIYAAITMMHVMRNAVGSVNGVSN